MAIRLLRLKYFNVDILQLCNYSHTINKSLDLKNLKLGALSFITMVNKEIFLIYISCITLCAFLFVLGLQDIACRFK